MDYNKLSKQELIDICNDNDIKYIASNTKAELITLITDKETSHKVTEIKNDEVKKVETSLVQKNMENTKASYIAGLAGGILYLIGAIATAIFLKTTVFTETIGIFDILSASQITLFIATIVLAIAAIVMAKSDSVTSGVILVIAGAIGMVMFIKIFGTPTLRFDELIATIGSITLLTAGILKLCKL